MQLTKIIIKILIVIVFIYLQQCSMFFCYEIAEGDPINIKDIPFMLIGMEIAMMWYLPSSFFALFIIPLFVYLHKHAKTLLFSFVLFISLIILFYIIGMFTSFVLWNDEPNRYLIWGNNLSLEKQIVLYGYVLGNLLFMFFFIPIWHFLLQKVFTKKVIL